MCTVLFNYSSNSLIFSIFNSRQLTKPKAMKKSWNTSVYATDTKPPNNVYTTAIIALMTMDMVFSI